MIQIVVNALSTSAIIAPAALAFTLLYSLFGFANFSVGAFITVGAFATWCANVSFGMPLVVAALVGVIVTVAVVMAVDSVIFRPIRSASATALLLVSVALSLVLENVVRFIFGNAIRGFDLPLSRALDLGIARVTPEQGYAIALSGAALALIYAAFLFLPWGRAIRAAADNPPLAEVRGIKIAHVQRIICATAGLLTGLAGTLAGLDLAIEPSLGGALTISLLAAAILGGIGSISGAVAGALLVGLAEEASVLVLSPAYKQGVGFVIIALVLLLRPHGLFGRPVIRK